jgi:hypothetical protein
MKKSNKIEATLRQDVFGYRVLIVLVRKVHTGSLLNL